MRKNKIQKKIEKLPKYFIDSSVFLEVILRQAKYDKCFSFFYDSNYKHRLVTPIVVLGEIVKTLNKIEDIMIKNQSYISFVDIFEKTEIGIMELSFECINNIGDIKTFEPYLQSYDSILFSSAVTENCDAFVTLDSDFSSILSLKFDIRIKNP